MKMSRCLLFEKKMPRSFWVEIVNNATYLLNRLLARTLNDSTPYKAWDITKLALDHFKDFGSIYWTHLLEIKRDKLGERVEMGNFIGYSYSLKAYKIFNPENGKILVHKDVKVDEDVWYNCEE